MAEDNPALLGAESSAGEEDDDDEDEDVHVSEEITNF